MLLSLAIAFIVTPGWRCALWMKASPRMRRRARHPQGRSTGALRRCSSALPPLLDARRGIRNRRLLGCRGLR